MAVVTEALKAELLYRVREEVLGTSFYFRNVSVPNSTSACRALAIALDGSLVDVEETLGNDFKWDCIKVSPVGYSEGWSHERTIRHVGEGVGVSIDEMLTMKVSILSESQDSRRITNRNQISGMVESAVVNGRVGDEISTPWLNTLGNWATGDLQEGGFQFKLVCGHRVNQQWEFFDAEIFKINQFVGSRIDRIKNRDNRGNRRAAVAQPAQ